MKVLVIGATRGIGALVMKGALESGHAVIALVRDPSSVSMQHEKLSVERGDVLDRVSVGKAARGTDAIVCALGLSLAASRKPTVLYSRGTENILDVMHEKGMKRLIAVTGIGAGDSRGHGGFFYDRIFQPLFLNEGYKDKTRQEELIRATKLDWVIVRPGMLTDGPETGVYRVINGGEYVAGKISRADVARFILQQLEQETYLRKAVVLSY
jgi:putative NADH-flavin reductase